MRYSHVAARVFDVPLLIEAGKLAAILHVLGPRLGFDAPDAPADAIEYGKPEDHMRAFTRLRHERTDDGYLVFEGGVAIVPVIGSLVQRSDWMAEASGMTSYAKIERMLAGALGDSRVREIVLELDSPGGEVAGAFDLADRIYAARGEKPITAISSEAAFSAAYLIASAAKTIVLPRTGMVGSIGVVAAHIDNSKALEKRGQAVTFVYAGEKKVDGNPFEPLSDRARADWQREIDALYSMFVETVARNRGVDPEAVRATQAGVFMGEAAIAAGLADRVATFADELGAAVQRQAGPFRLNAQRKENTMSDEQKGNGGPVTFTAEQVQAARQEAHAAALAEGRSEIAPAVAAERGRIKAIVTHAEAEGRGELAAHLAFETDMPAEQATALLGKSPKAAGQTPLERAMAQVGTPGVGAQPPKTTTQAAPDISVQQVYANRRAAVAAKK